MELEYLYDLDDLTCKDCLKQFKYKSLYHKHINKKKSCKINEDIEIIRQKHINITHRINDKIKKSVLDICYFCNKKFTTKANLIYHIKHNCQIHKDLISEKEKYKK